MTSINAEAESCSGIGTKSTEEQQLRLFFIKIMLNLDDEGAGATDRVALLAMLPDRLESGSVGLGPEVIEAVEAVGQRLVGAVVRFRRVLPRKDLKNKKKTFCQIK